MYARVLLGNLLCVHVQAFEDFEVYSDDVCPVNTRMWLGYVKQVELVSGH